MIQHCYACYTVEESTLRQSKRTFAPLHLISSLLGSCHTKKTGFQSVKSSYILVFSKRLTMAQLFFVCPKRSNHAAFRHRRNCKNELSLKSMKMRVSDTKKPKMVHFPIFQIAETKQSCGVDDNPYDNQTLQRCRVSLSIQTADKSLQVCPIKPIDKMSLKCLTMPQNNASIGVSKRL